MSTRAPLASLARLVLGLSLFTGTALVAACSSDDRPPGAGSSSGNTSGGPIPREGGANTDGPVGPVDPAVNATLCDSTEQIGGPVEETEVGGEVPPARGGALVPGAYQLREMQKYVPFVPTDGGGDPGLGLKPTTGVVGRSTLYVFATGVIRTVGARGNASGVPNDKVEGFTYTSKATSLDLVPVCPSAGAVKVVPYSAEGSTLVLQIDGTHTEIYVRP